MSHEYFSALLPEIAECSTQAALRQLNIQNPALRAWMTQALAQEEGLLGEPVFEAAFGWCSAQPTLQELPPGLLSPSLLAVLDAPKGDAGHPYRFGRDFHPHQHQLRAWELLAQPTPQSVVVSGGTGSGKTECFLVSLLNDLVQEVVVSGELLVGVRALMIYPLNALIASQQERLHAWTYSLEGVRFGLLNGSTPGVDDRPHVVVADSQVYDRKTLRESPPPILVTNPTMLEYMLIRTEDQPILQASQGQLRWIVLDEAHTYVGAKGAELALLLRRVMLAFGVRAEDVHFVATSASLGGEGADAQLQRFLATVAGLPLDRVHVVRAQRDVPRLPRSQARYVEATYDELMAVPEKRLYRVLCANKTAKRIRNAFLNSQANNALTLSSVVDAMAEGAGTEDSRHQALQWLDLLTRARNERGAPFLPLRLHAFHDVLGGLWACSNPLCFGRKGTALDAPEWSFGRVYKEVRRTCECHAPVYEIRACTRCHEIYLWAEWRECDRDVLVRPVAAEADDYANEAVGEADEPPFVARDMKADWSPLLITKPHEFARPSHFYVADSYFQHGREFARTVTLLTLTEF